MKSTLLVILLLAGACTVPPRPALTLAPNVGVIPENTLPDPVESLARRLMDQLEQRGYQVARGYFKLYTKEDCDASYAVMGTCFGNNPAAPYVMPVMPSWPDEWVDPATIGAFGSTAACYSVSFRFAPREAIVILGLLPPPAKYFGLQTYLATRQGDYKKDSPQYKYVETLGPDALNMLFTYVPDNPDRIEIFGTLSNSINNVVIERQSGAAFDQLRFFIITPDQLMDHAVREALSSISVAGKDIFTEPIPSNMSIGLDEAADDFTTWIRYAMPLDAGAARPRSDAWRDELPLVVLRIRDVRTEPQPVAYPPVVLEQRTAAQNPSEIDLLPDLINLVQAVCQKWGQPCDDADPQASEQRPPYFANRQVPPIMFVGPDCTDAGMNCLADNLDTVYYISSQVPVDDQRVYAVVGVLSTQTGNATYVGLGLNASARKLGFDNVSDDELTGSADAYGTAVADPDKFFVYYFARDCAGLEPLTAKYCRSVPEAVLPTCNPEDPDCDILSFSLRG